MTWGLSKERGVSTGVINFLQCPSEPLTFSPFMAWLPSASGREAHRLMLPSRKGAEPPDDGSALWHA